MITVAVGTVLDNGCAEFAWYADAWYGQTRDEQVGVYHERASIEDVCDFVRHNALGWTWAPLRLVDGLPALTLIRNGADFSLVGDEVEMPHTVRRFRNTVYCKDCDASAGNVHELALEPCRCL